VLARFASAHQITFPLLTDEGSAVIRRYGILNTNIPPTHVFSASRFPANTWLHPTGA
jgi:peroxiredoxin